jgi:uncharacterized protein (TIGR03435 family)
MADRIKMAFIASLLFLPMRVWSSAVQQNQPLVFEVATIKPSRPEEQRSVVIRGPRFTTTATSVSDLIMFAYEIQARQIADAPRWLETEKYDVTGLPPDGGQPNRQELRLMVRTLLADRFDLTFHQEKKELPVFRIAASKTGPKLSNSSDPNGNPRVGFGSGVITAKSATISDFAEFLQRYLLDRPVVDRTGLTGKYDFTLNWTPDSLQTAGHDFPPTDRPTLDVPDFFTAIQQQLGLKLESVKEPVDIFVIDHVERPSEN